MTNTLPIFERDSQRCACGHICGMHGSYSLDGEFMGIGLGACGYGHNRKFDPDTDVTDPGCDCKSLTLA